MEDEKDDYLVLQGNFGEGLKIIPETVAARLLDFASDMSFRDDENEFWKKVLTILQGYLEGEKVLKLSMSDFKCLEKAIITVCEKEGLSFKEFAI